MITKVVMPKLSDAMETGKVIQWLKKEGERVKGGDIIAEIETDKANVEIEAFGSGVLRKIMVDAGGEVPVGQLIGVIAEPAEDIGSVLSAAARAGRSGARVRSARCRGARRPRRPRPRAACPRPRPTRPRRPRPPSSRWAPCRRAPGGRSGRRACAGSA